MPVDFVGKVLFPRLQPWQRRRQIKTMTWVFIAALVFAAAMAAVILMTNGRPK